MQSFEESKQTVIYEKDSIDALLVDEPYLVRGTEIDSQEKAQPTGVFLYIEASDMSNPDTLAFNYTVKEYGED